MITVFDEKGNSLNINDLAGLIKSVEMLIRRVTDLETELGLMKLPLKYDDNGNPVRLYDLPMKFTGVDVNPFDGSNFPKPPPMRKGDGTYVHLTYNGDQFNER